MYKSILGLIKIETFAAIFPVIDDQPLKLIDHQPCLNALICILILCYLCLVYNRRSSGHFEFILLIYLVGVCWKEVLDLQPLSA